MEPVVSGGAAAAGAADAMTLFFSSRSSASAMCASFAAGSACARSTRSRRSASLANWPLALCDAPSRFAFSAGQLGELGLGRLRAAVRSIVAFAVLVGQKCATPVAERDPTKEPSAAAAASDAASMAKRNERAYASRHSPARRSARFDSSFAASADDDPRGSAPAPRRSSAIAFAGIELRRPNDRQFGVAGFAFRRCFAGGGLGGWTALFSAFSPSSGFLPALSSMFGSSALRLIRR